MAEKSNRIGTGMKTVYRLLPRRSRTRLLERCVGKTPPLRRLAFPADLSKSSRAAIILPHDPFEALFHLGTISWMAQNLGKKGALAIVCERRLEALFASLAEYATTVTFSRELLMPFTPHTMQLTEQLQNLQIDICFLLEPKPEPGLLLAIGCSQAPIRIGFSQESLTPFVNFSIVADSTPPHARDQWITGAFGLQSQPKSQWKVSRESSESISSLLRECGLSPQSTLIGIDATLCSRGEQWFRELASMLSATPGFSPYICRGPLSPGPDVTADRYGIPLVPELPLGRCAALVHRSALMIVGKSTLMHVCTLLRKPMVNVLSHPEIADFLMPSAMCVPVPTDDVDSPPTPENVMGAVQSLVVCEPIEIITM